MGRLDVSILRYLDSEAIRALTAVEMGMKNHEFVPVGLIASIANFKYGGAHKVVKDISRHRLLAYEKSKSFQGYRLTNRGYDYLALRVLTRQEKVYAVGNQIGIGKESDIYVVTDNDREEYALKIHRLGRTSFRQLKNKRDYHAKRNTCSWIYLSRIAATKEFAFMSVLHKNGFPVPKPHAHNRHCVVMELVNGYTLQQIYEIEDVEKVFTDLMNLILRLANNGLIHGDFNEFNLMISDEGQVTLIDFPQMMSISHSNAKFYFDRDVQCVKDFFYKRFGFECDETLDFEKDVTREGFLDKELSASGYRNYKKESGEDDEEDGDTSDIEFFPDEDRQENDEDDDDDDDDDDDEDDDDDDDQNELSEQLESKCTIAKNCEEESQKAESSTDEEVEDTEEKAKKWMRKALSKEQKQQKHRRLMKGEAGLKTKSRRNLRYDISSSMKGGFF